MFFLQSLLLALLFVSTILILKTVVLNKGKNNKSPPSPRKLPIIGNFHQLGSRPHQALQSLSQRHGPLMLLHFGSVPVLVVSSADAAREILKTHDTIFSTRPKLTIPNILLFGSKDMAFSPYGEYWRQIRSIGVIHLLSNKKVESYRNVREEETALVIEEIRKGSENSLILNLSEMFMKLPNDVVCRVALGRKYSKGRFMELMEEFEELLGVFCIGDYVPWLRWVDRVSGLLGRVEKVFHGLDDILAGVIEEHIRKGVIKGEQKDFVDILLQYQRDNIYGSPIHVDTIKGLIVDMFTAGTHTTFAGLEWAIAELLKHPEAMEKLKFEVRQTTKGKANVTEGDLDNMLYLKSVIKESMRLHAPAPLLLPRESTQDVKLMGYDIVAGTQVIINAWAIGKDPSLWEESEEFRPERFLNSSIDYRGFHFELIPFGAGRRGCPGTSFAIAIIELALANLVKFFDIALPGGARGEDIDMTETSGTTVHKKSPLLIVATPCS